MLDRLFAMASVLLLTVRLPFETLSTCTEVDSVGMPASNVTVAPLRFTFCTFALSGIAPIGPRLDCQLLAVDQLPLAPPIHVTDANRLMTPDVFVTYVYE